jgi:cardiolipin synthase C
VTNSENSLPQGQDTADTRLARVIRQQALAHPGLSGVVPLADGHDAFAARAHLLDAAEHTIDVQYYIWHNDMSGTLLLGALLRAAERGVRVRVLLDDNNTRGLDILLAALDAHPNIEVRLFNPFKFRRWRLLNFLTDFQRLNRRMHNKSFTVDNHATIIGGRNVGDEYFGADQGVLFVDLDVLAIGPVVNEVSLDFERYWSSQSSFPAKQLLFGVSSASISPVVAAASAIERSPAALAYVQALRDSVFVEKMLARQLPFEWATVRMVSDDPAKGLGLAAKDDFLWDRLKRILKTSTQELQLISAYFVPTAAGVEFFNSLARRGVKVTVLTNSMEATDVPAVHAGYAKRRKPLLKAGIRLFELKRASARPSVKAPRLTGSSASSLHTKTFSVDRSRVFIGSFNFDPRSTGLNTEMGFVIESPTMAKAIAEKFSATIPARAYQVELSGEGPLLWVEQLGGKELVHDCEPGTTLCQRMGVTVLSVLPIEWLL